MTTHFANCRNRMGRYTSDSPRLANHPAQAKHRGSCSPDDGRMVRGSSLPGCPYDLHHPSPVKWQ